MTARTTRFLPAALAALITALTATAATAQPMHGGPGACGERHEGGRHGMSHHRAGPMGGAGFLRGLNLTDAQQDKVFELHHAQAPRERERMKIAHEARQALHALAAADGWDAKRAKELAQTHAQAMADLALMHAEFAQKVRAVLTPEQRKEADARFAERAKDDDRGPGFGPGFGHRPF